jgi:F-type H+-transporting ATPase subunit epsilon
MLFVTGEMGELGISPGHSQLLTSLRPGYVRAVMPGKKEEEEQVFYVSGGMLEVQPYIVSVLADDAKRADDIDEAAAIAAKEQAEKALAGKKSEIDMARATTELAEVSAQLRAIHQLKRRAKGGRV